MIVTPLPTVIGPGNIALLLAPIDQLLGIVPGASYPLATVTSVALVPVAASAKLGGEPAPPEVNTCPEVPGPIATGSPLASY